MKSFCVEESAHVYDVTSAFYLYLEAKIPFRQRICFVHWQELHVISTDENRVVAAVQEWNQNETYNLYVSDTSGVYYSLALENVVSSMGLEGNVMVDLYEVSKQFAR